MEIQRTTRDGCLVVTFTGTIDLSSVSWIQRSLLKELGERPLALVCDLSGVSTLDPVCAAVFATVANHPSSRWPDTSFLLCGAQPSVAQILSRLQVPHFLHLYADVEEAIDAAVARPPYLRDELLLAPTPTAPAAARAFVQQVCLYWQLALPDETLLARAVLLANELVTNAVVHAHTDIRLRLELRGDRLHIGCGTANSGCCAWSPRTHRRREGAGCGWSSSSPRPGESTTTPLAARPCGAPSTCDDHEALPAGRLRRVKGPRQAVDAQRDGSCDAPACARGTECSIGRGRQGSSRRRAGHERRARPPGASAGRRLPWRPAPVHRRPMAPVPGSVAVVADGTHQPDPRDHRGGRVGPGRPCRAAGPGAGPPAHGTGQLRFGLLHHPGRPRGRHRRLPVRPALHLRHRRTGTRPARPRNLGRYR